MPNLIDNIRRTAKAGELVVPVNEILDRLRGRVGNELLDDVLDSIVSARRNRVSPGELITADLVNQMLGQLESLETRVTALEATGPDGDAVVITGLLPSGAVTMGSELTVVGRNLGAPGSVSVIVDGVAINQFKPGSGNDRLTFNLPALQGVPAQGKIVTLTLSNTIGIATTSFIILPAQPTTPSGSLFVTLTQPPPGPQLLAGQSYTFGYTLKAITDLEEVFTLTPIVAAGWPAFIVDSNNIPSPVEITIPKSDPPAGTSRIVRMRVTIPPGIATGTISPISLRVTSKRNPENLSQASAGDNIIVGNPPPQAQEIAVSFSNVIGAPGTPAASENNGVVTIPVSDTQYRITFLALIKDPGAYRVVVTSPGSAWAVRISGAATATPLEITLNPTASNTSNLINVLVTAQAGAQQGNLVVRVTQVDDPTVSGQATERVRLSQS